MQSQYGTAAEAAILAKTRKLRAKVVVDWNNNGLYDHALSDISRFVSEVTTDQSLQGSVPSEILLIEGSASAEMTLTIGGIFQGQSLTRIFSPYNQASPLIDKATVGAEIKYYLIVDGPLGSYEYPQFVGDIRTIAPDRASDEVKITALDRVEKLRKAIQLPGWAVSEEMLNNGEENSMVAHSHWVIDSCLRLCDVGAGPKRPTYRHELHLSNLTNSLYPGEGQQFFATLNGSTIPTVGHSENQWASSFPSGTAQMYSDVGPFHPNAPEGSLRPQAVTGVGLPISQVRGNPSSQGILRWWIHDREDIQLAGTHYLGFTLNNVNSNAYQSIGLHNAMEVRIGLGYELQIQIQTGQVRSRVMNSANNTAVATSSFVNIPSTPANVDIFVQWDLTEQTGMSCYVAAGSNNSGTVSLGTAPSTGSYADPVRGRVTVGHALSVSDVFYTMRKLYGVPAFYTDDSYRTVKYPAVLDRGKNRFSYLPSAKPQEAWSIISGVASAEMGAVFWDETGTFRFWNSDTILGKQNVVVRDLTLDDVTGLSITNTLDSIRNEYTVNALKKRAVGIVNVYKSSDPNEFVVLPGSRRKFRLWVDDVVSPWTQVMRKYISNNTPELPSLFPKFEDSVPHGYCIQHLIGGVWQESRTLGAIDIQCYFTADGYLMVDIWNAWPHTIRLAQGNIDNTEGNADNSQAAFHLGGSKVLAGATQAVFTRNIDSINKYDARNLTLEGEWYQDTIEGLNLIGNLAQRTGEPIPATDQITIAGDPRLQLGDTVSVDDPDGFGTDIKLQILGVNRTFSKDGGLTDQLTVEMVAPGGPTVDPDEPDESGDPDTGAAGLRTNLQRNPNAADNTDTQLGPGPAGSAFVTGQTNMVRTTGYRLSGATTDGKWSPCSVISGRTYRASVFIKPVAATTGSAHITWYEADNTRISSTPSTSWEAAAGQVIRADTGAQVAPQNASKARLYIKTDGALVMTGALFEETSFLRDYFDANTPGARLNSDDTSSIGTANPGGGNDGGGTGGPAVFANPAAANNIGTGTGKNHFNLGIGFASAHTNIQPATLEGGYSESDHYTLSADGQRARLRVYMNGKKTSANTQYPRCEYREYGLTNSEISFDSRTGVHRLKGTTRFTHLQPVKPWAVIFQLHDDESDVYRVQSEVVGGKLGIVCRNTVPGSSTENKKTLVTELVMNQDYVWESIITNGTCKIYLNGVQVHSFNAGGTGMYYKFGVYAQSNDSIDSASEYSEVEVSNCEHWHTGWPDPVPSTPTGPSNPGGGGGGSTGGGTTGTTAAQTFNWGDPDPSSDVFNYTGLPNASKWDVYGNGGSEGGTGSNCWVGHDGNGRRCVKNAYCTGEYLRITGQPNGDTAGISHKFNQQYGRWEVRARFTKKTGATGNKYHPVLIIWPQSDRWPEDGEYDFVEVDIGDTTLEAFLHYPHPANVAVQQENPSKSGVDITEWHNYGFEWTSSGLKGFVDGVQWFSYSGGAGPSGRSAIQAMPSGHLTIQLDNFFGASGMQEAYMDVQWAKVYKLNGTGTGGGGTGSSQAQINQEKAFQITSTAENSTKNWWDSYKYIEDVKDGRGYTGGIVGFTSATGDMLELIERYLELNPSSALAPYLDDLQACAAYGDTVDDAVYGVNGGGASTIANSRLGSAYRTLWTNEANNNATFRATQRDFRNSMYWLPAYNAAVADGVGPLGLALYYDTSVNHGPGENNSNDGSFNDIRSRTTGTKPKNGGSEQTWLTNFLNKRSAVLTSWGDNPSDGRVKMFKDLIATKNWQLTTPFSWKVYGDTFTMSTDPAPHND